MENTRKSVFSVLPHEIISRGHPGSAQDSPEPSSRPFPISLAILVGLMAAVICAAFFFVFDHQRGLVRQESEDMLAAVASLKALQIRNWLEERKGDAVTQSNQSHLAALMKEMRQSGALSSANRQWMQSHLEVIRRAYQYSALELFDTGGKRLFATQDAIDSDNHETGLAQLAMRSRRVQMSDLHLGESKQPELDFVAPLLMGEDGRSEVLGTLHFRVDPTRFLFPLIESWHTPSKTAETLLIRHDDGHIIFLNRLRHRSNEALNFRLQIATPLLLAAQAVKGKAGLVSGVDYRGNVVIGYIQPISGTPWFMVAKIDEAEVYAPINRLAGYVVIAVVALVLATSGMLLFWWRQRREAYLARDYHNQIEKQRLEEQTERFALATIDALSSHICVLDENGTVVAVNKAWREYARNNHLADPSDNLGSNYLNACKAALGNDAQTAAEFANGIRSVMRGEVSQYVHEYACDSADSSRWFIGRVSRFTGDWPARVVIAHEDITERKQAEEALLRAKDRLALAQRASGAGVWDWDMKTGKLTWSDELFHMFGLDRNEDEASFDSWHRALHPEDRKLAQERVENAIREHLPLSQEYRIVLPNGEVHWIQAMGDTTYDEQGEAVRMAGICIDVTARKTDEARIRLDREHENALRLLVESILVGGTLEETLLRCLDHILAVSWLALLPKGGIFLMEADNAQLRLTAVRNLPTEILSLCGRVPLGHCLCGRAAEKGQMEYAAGVDKRHEIGYPGMNDHAHYSVPFVSGGHVVGVLVLYLPSGTPRDAEKEFFLTSAAGILATYLSRYAIEQELVQQYDHLEEEIVKRTAALATTEARTRAILRTMLDGVVQIDAEGHILSANDAVERIFGYEEAELVGRNINLLMPEPFRSKHDSHLRNYKHTHKSAIIGRRLEVSGLHKDGMTFPLDLAVNELIDDSGTTFIGVLRDITQQKAAESAREVARAEAEAANRAKGFFLATMSHEIRTPINAILGMTHLAQKTDLTPKQRDYVDKTHKAGQHLLGIINDILDFSKIEDGSLQVETVDFLLDDIVKEVASLTTESAASKGLRLDFDVDHVPHGLRGDPLRLSQVLINLISNAVKFTERGEIVVRMERLEENARDVLIRCQVRDSGVGISDTVKSTLFQPFRQADASTSRKYGGTGLGLAISRQLVEMMGGSIGVESTPGQGSTFWFTVRLAKGDAPAAVRESSVKSFAMLEGMRILLAEDNLFNQQVAAELLESVGATVCVAANGLEALDLLGQERFDIVLMDVQMPEMDGLETTERLRSNPSLAGLPVIAMTANASHADRERCLAAGMDDFVPKPVPPERLYEVLAKWLGRSAGAARPKPDEQAGIAPAKTVNPPAIDLTALGKMIRNDPEKIHKFAMKFLESAEDGLTEIEAAMARGDLAALAMSGHRLKSSARTVGAAGFADLCQSLEQFRNGGDIEQARSIVAALRPLLQRIRQEINA